MLIKEQIWTGGRRRLWGSGGPVFPSSALVRWAFSPHFTDNEMESRRILPPTPELDTKARTRTLALLPPGLGLNCLGQLVSFSSGPSSVLKFWSQAAEGNREPVLTTQVGQAENGKARTCPHPPRWAGVPDAETAHIPASFTRIFESTACVSYRICNASRASNRVPSPHCIHWVGV